MVSDDDDVVVDGDDDDDGDYDDDAMMLMMLLLIMMVMMMTMAKHDDRILHETQNRLVVVGSGNPGIPVSLAPSRPHTGIQECLWLPPLKTKPLEKQNPKTLTPTTRHNSGPEQPFHSPEPQAHRPTAWWESTSYTGMPSRFRV